MFQGELFSPLRSAPRGPKTDSESQEYITGVACKSSNYAIYAVPARSKC